MKTPVYDYIASYMQSGTLRMHMPGHKGKKSDNLLSEIFSMDITEITGAGNLFENEGIIAESEKYASELFGTKATFYSAQGSTLCIQTMLALMKRERRNVIAVRNVHRAFLSACVLLDITPEWIFPEYTDTVVSGRISTDRVEEVLRRTENACLYVTSPDYLGAMADIKSLSELCHRYGAVLLVDNAHGALLPFYSTNRHPVYLGADLCCDSAHKMLPALTGAAYLHAGNERYIPWIKDTMLLFASTSPSYLITCSLDLCNRYIDEKIRSGLADAEIWAEELRNSTSGRFVSACPAFEMEPLHFTINAGRSGTDGTFLAAKLRENGIEYEYADDTYVVLLFSPEDGHEVYLRVAEVLSGIEFEPVKHESGKLVFPKPERCMSLREAALSPSAEIPAEESEGCICAGTNVPCPPAVPVAVSGELISGELVRLMKSCGIETVRVVRSDS